MEYLRIRNWEKYQDTAGHNTEYVKLCPRILLDMEYMGLPDRERLCFILLLAYAGVNSNKIPNDANMIMHLCHFDEEPDLSLMSMRGLIEEWSETKHTEMIEKHGEKLKYWREQKRKQRKNKGVPQMSNNGQTKDMSNVPSYTETETETETEKNKTLMSKPPVSTCPIQEIVNLYHQTLPTLPQCRKLTAARQAAIRQRWREDITNLEDWQDYFEFIKRSDFLMGRAQQTNGHKLFRASLDWIVKADNYAKIYEGKYHG